LLAKTAMGLTILRDLKRFKKGAQKYHERITKGAWIKNLNPTRSRLIPHLPAFHQFRDIPCPLIANGWEGPSRCEQAWHSLKGVHS